ncbi:aldehyde dehydrogenase family protein, partial [Endozoicomonas sp.]|nr:aldehyde dehydrogenase family protein [Endozoicomonas sp.]
MILKSFVHGKETDYENGEFSIINPASGKEAYRAQYASKEVIQYAVASAKKGFKQWSRFSAEQRQHTLLRVAQLLRDNREKLAKIEVIDTGKPLQEALSVDLPSSAEVFEYYAGLANAIEGTQHFSGEDFFYTRREPIGLCAGIGAWNYPLQIACWKVAPALACGNTMIFKPSEHTPKSAIELAKIIIEAG